MNKLDPLLKRLLLTAEKVNRSSLNEREEAPTREAVLRILNRCGSFRIDSQPSLLELMVQRGATLAAAFGVLSLAVLLLPGGSASALLSGITGPCAALFHTLLL